MGRFDNGVSWYTSGTAYIRVHFPEGEVRCRYCRYCRDDSMGRYWCRLTGDMLYSLDHIGVRCPIELDADKKGEET